jgi:hypothetical protein
MEADVWTGTREERVVVLTRAEKKTAGLSHPVREGTIPPSRSDSMARRGVKAGEFPQDAASVSTALRDLAVRAHRAVRAADVTESRPGATGPATDSDRELSELHARIVLLEQSLGEQSLARLAPYVSALRRKIEDRLRLVRADGPLLAFADADAGGGWEPRA